MLNNFEVAFKKSQDRQQFIDLVKKEYPKRKKSTIQRDYYRLLAVVKRNGQGLGLDTTIKSNAIDPVVPEVGSEWLSSQELAKLPIMKQIMLKDMVRFKYKITKQLLQTNGFTTDEINKILGGVKNEENNSREE